MGSEKIKTIKTVIELLVMSGVYNIEREAQMAPPRSFLYTGVAIA